MTQAPAMPPHLPGEREGACARPGTSRRLSALAAFLAVGACALGPQPAIGGAEERRLFAEVYESITEYYVEPASADRLSLAGLRRLTALDPEIVVARAGDALVLRRGFEE